LPYVLTQFGVISWVFVYLAMWVLYLAVWFNLRKNG